jgi:hypothetical protein
LLLIDPAGQGDKEKSERMDSAGINRHGVTNEKVVTKGLANHAREPGESVAAWCGEAAGRWVNAMSDKTYMHDSGESYDGVRPAKRPNKSGRPPAEAVEERPPTRENAGQPNPYWTPSQEAGQAGWTGCARQQGGTGRRGSRRCFTT